MVALNGTMRSFRSCSDLRAVVVDVLRVDARDRLREHADSQAAVEILAHGEEPLAADRESIQLVEVEHQTRTPGSR